VSTLITGKVTAILFKECNQKMAILAKSSSGHNLKGDHWNVPNFAVRKFLNGVHVCTKFHENWKELGFFLLIWHGMIQRPGHYLGPSIHTCTTKVATKAIVCWDWSGDLLITYIDSDMLNHYSMYYAWIYSNAVWGPFFVQKVEKVQHVQ